MTSDSAEQAVYLETQVRASTFGMLCEHYHTHYELYYLRSGQCTYCVNGLYYHLTAGDIMLIIPGDKHSTRYEGIVNCERVVVFFRPEVLPKEFLTRLPDISRLLSRSAKVLLNPPARVQLEDILHRMTAESGVLGGSAEEFLHLYVQEYLLLLKYRGIFSYETYTPVRESNRDIESAIRFMTMNYSQPLTLEAVAKTVNFSPTYFSHRFRKVTGVTFKEQLNRIRLKQAGQLLMTTDESITKIATACGFNSSNYFKDVFRRTMGLSPREYRKQIKTPVRRYTRSPVSGNSR